MITMLSFWIYFSCSLIWLSKIKTLYLNFLFVLGQTFFLFIGISFILLQYTNCVSVANFLLKFNINFNNSLFLDGVSLSLIWLTIFLCLLCFLYNYNVIGFSYTKYNFLLLLIEFLVVLCFSVQNLLEFYIYFELILIPMFILIGLGSRGRKAHAVYLFFFYTFLSSLFLLTGIVFIFFKINTLNFEVFYVSKFTGWEQLLIFSLFFLGFAAKIPILPLHLWLPEAHVEAPTVGSVLLAGILLKLGAYGIFRVIFPICEFETLAELQPYVFSLLLISLLYSGLAAIRQVDLKKIVAYSSVSHMSFSLFGLLAHVEYGIRGFLFLLISHGLISSAMFFCVGMLYDRFHVRNIFYFGGLGQYLPLFSICYFIILFSNMSFPGTCNFIGEYFVLISVFDLLGIFFILFIFIGLFTVVVFCLLLLYKVLFYQVSGLLVTNLVDLTIFEFLILSVLIFYIGLFGLVPNVLWYLFL